MSLPVPKTVLIGGYAKLPSGITAGELYNVVAIGAEVDWETGRIVDADCTLATQTAKRFFLNLIVGRSVSTEIDQIIAEIEERYHGNAQKALITAVKSIHSKFESLKADRANEMD